MSSSRILAVTILAAGAAVAGARAQTLTTLYTFQGGTDGIGPAAALTYQNGTLYGTTNQGGKTTCPPSGAIGCGVAFSVDPTTGAETVLYIFQGGADGAIPGPLLYQGGDFYGMTAYGGDETSKKCGDVGCGTVFSLNPTTGAETVLYDFARRPFEANALLSHRTFLYGTTDESSTVFRIKPSGGRAKTIAELNFMTGNVPAAGLIENNGTFYGTGSMGGAHNDGAVFSINPTTGAVTTLYSFGSGSDGIYPGSLLVYRAGILYGTTRLGGTSGKGTIFSIDLATNAETVLYSFQGGSDGQYPIGNLAVIAGRIYGTTQDGGRTPCNDNSGCGTIYAFNTTTGIETVLYDFLDGADGAVPIGGLIAEAGTLYGTTAAGGSSTCTGSGYGPGCGTVFAITP